VCARVWRCGNSGVDADLSVSSAQVHMYVSATSATLCFLASIAEAAFVRQPLLDW
jgi:hypothetical protein